MWDREMVTNWKPPAQHGFEGLRQGVALRIEHLR